MMMMMMMMVMVDKRLSHINKKPHCKKLRGKRGLYQRIKRFFAGRNVYKHFSQKFETDYIHTSKNMLVSSSPKSSVDWIQILSAAIKIVIRNCCKKLGTGKANRTGACCIKLFSRL